MSSTIAVNALYWKQTNENKEINFDASLSWSKWKKMNNNNS